MKCKHVLQRLLATSGHRTLSADVVAHLDGCDRCRCWGERLHQIDAAVPSLTVPDARAAKSALIEQFLAPSIPAIETAWPLGRVRITWVRAVATVAAVVVLGLAVTGVFNREPRVKPEAASDVLLAKIVDRNIALAAAETVEQRVGVLDELANDLDASTRSMAYTAAADDLNALAEMYESVVRGDRGLVVQADNVPRANRQKVLEQIAKRLRETSVDAEKKSRDVPNSAMAALKRIAATARDAHDTIRRKIREENLAQDDSARRGEGKS